jgi:hypothetical protein
MAANGYGGDFQEPGAGVFPSWQSEAANVAVRVAS